MYVQPLQPELACCSLQSSPCPAACFGQICLEWLCWTPPVPLGCFGHGLCVSGWLQGVVPGFLYQPHSLSAQKLSGGYFTPSKSRGKELLTLSILKSTVYVLLMVSVFHCQWSPKALKERDCLPIPAHSSVGSVTFVLLKGFPGMDSQDPI